MCPTIVFFSSEILLEDKNLMKFRIEMITIYVATCTYYSLILLNFKIRLLFLQERISQYTVKKRKKKV